MTFSNYKNFININEDYLRNLKNLKSLNQINYKKSRYDVKKLIAEKKRNYFETKLTENIGKPKELWKTLKALGLPNNVSTETINALEDDALK